jgi:hypothetical protein
MHDRPLQKVFHLIGNRRAPALSIRFVSPVCSSHSDADITSTLQMEAAVGPMLREVLIGEVVNALGIPTNFAHAVAATGGPVCRSRTDPASPTTPRSRRHLEEMLDTLAMR